MLGWNFGQIGSSLERGMVGPAARSSHSTEMTKNITTVYYFKSKFEQIHTNKTKNQEVVIKQVIFSQYLRNKIHFIKCAYTKIRGVLEELN